MRKPIGAKPPVSAWLVRERKAAGMKPAEVAARLTAMGLPVQEGTVRTWEAGRSPSPENIEGLERILESRAPSSGEPHSTELGTLASRVDVLTGLVARLQSEADDREARVRALEAELAEHRAPRAGGASPTRSVPAATGE